MLDHGVRDAAQELAAQAAQAAVPDNDKFRAQFLGELQDLGVRASHPQVRPRDPRACSSRIRCASCQTTSRREVYPRISGW